jgi:hypothetical protein
MSKSRNNLKIISIVVLILAAISLVNVASGLIFGALNDAEIPDGAPENTLLIAKIFLAVVSVIMLAPHVYVGIKGIKVANKPDSSKAHIVWAILLLAFAAYCLISPIASIIMLEDVLANIFSVISIAAEIIVFVMYLKFAFAVSKGK